MQIQTTRFGAVDIDEQSVLTMTHGLLGFEDITQYCLIPHAPDSPFRWLQAATMPELAFIVVNPFDFFPDYDVSLPEADARRIGVQAPDQVAVLSVVTARNGELTANLIGPIVVNTVTQTAAQVVLTDSHYSTRHSLVPASAA
jgi:flagellar assembly factor FliW